MAKDQFDTPHTGDYVQMADLFQHLVLITPTEYIAVEKDPATGEITGGVSTENGVKDAVVADIVDLDTGETYDGAMIFQGHLVGALKRNAATQRPMLGVISKGEAKKKNWNPPYLLEAPTDEQKQFARDFLAGRTVERATSPVVEDEFAV